MILEYNFDSYPIEKNHVWLPPLRAIAYIQIPKCGTTTMRSLFDWTLGNAQGKHKDMQRLVILRSPIQRWRSAIVEAIYPKGEGDFEENLLEFARWGGLFDGRHDRHLWSQCHYLNGIDTDNTVFIRLEQLSEKLPLILDVENVPQLKQSSDPNKAEVLEFVDSIIEELTIPIIRAYQQDFELMEIVNFI